jgi:hypothetical protein
MIPPLIKTSIVHFFYDNIYIWYSMRTQEKNQQIRSLLNVSEISSNDHEDHIKES